jgi:uncharacterized protein (DUF1015 family)
MMAEVIPFQGVRYNPALISDMAAVVAPPYDVISPKEQIAFHERHPNNVIRLILGQVKPTDDSTDNVHLRAGRYFQQWQAQQILVPDAVPAFYLTTVEFTSNATSYLRQGLIGRIRLEPFSKGIILPHERTFSKVKSERLMLMKACHANFSSIFGLYPDGDEILSRLAAITRQQSPVMDVTDSKGHRQKVWCLTDAPLNRELTAFFANRRIYIADGHHRYETALNYRDWVKENTPGFSSDHPANFVMMSLSSMKDPGMVILPAHRLLKQIPPEAISSLSEKLEQYFDITPVSLDMGMESALAVFNRLLAEKARQQAIGLYDRSHPRLQVMVLKDGVMDRLFKGKIEAALRDLDVTVLTHLIMMELMGFDQARLDDETKIAYRTTTQEAVATVDEGEADLAFILNPTKIEQVQRVAESGLIMPRKSTYFYPKVMSGQVFNPLR